MNLEERISKNRKEIVTDSYEMSIGELINLYKDGDLIIRPEYQRLFRWTQEQKTNLIESILLWFPLPSFFVYQQHDGKWELIDGLQRISTILQFVGILKNPEGNIEEALTLNETKKTPEFKNISWKNLNSTLQRDFKRSRIRVEILKSTSDKLARYELFQRLNRGGSILTPQEVRNCTLSMLNPEALYLLQKLSKNKDFIATTSLTDEARQKSFDIELVLRFFSYASLQNYLASDKRLSDIHIYLDDFAMEFAQRDQKTLHKDEKLFKTTFSLINNSCGKNTFKKIRMNKFEGQFLLTKFEVITHGIYFNINKIIQLTDAKSFLENKIKYIDTTDTYKKYSGSGVRASSRLSHLLELGEHLFNPEV